MKTALNTLRSFAAIFPPPEIIEKIFFLQQQLLPLFPAVRWEKKEKFHFTLQFFGDVTEQNIEKINRDISNFCLHVHPFKISISKYGMFSNRYSPKIFWLGSTPEENTPLIELAEHIATITQKHHIPQENYPFHPHITLGRGKGKSSLNLIQKLETLTLHPLEFVCKEIHIMKSQLANAGSTYTILYTIPLK
ncbi:MAG: RNA 2',3'-cyclic phosphodiesterase [Bacteroidetes bacterium]|nr:RNA 2',3'-cyclic phosphodiesterase [Bacteroidota bacterium]